MPQLRLNAPLVVVAILATVSHAAVPTPAVAQTADDFVPVTDAMLQDPEPADWPMWRRTLDGWGFRCEDRISY